MKKTPLLNLTLSAMFLAIGFLLPMLTGQIQVIGNMLLPMHIPVLLCGLICGWQYGMTIGAILPIMRSLVFGMPPMYPTAVAMTFELAAYGLIIGLLYSRSHWKCIRSLYRCLIIAMLGGRVVWGLASLVLMGIQGDAFTLSAFLAGAFVNAVPGIIVQLVIIPIIMVALDKTKLVPFTKKSATTQNANG